MNKQVMTPRVVHDIIVSAAFDEIKSSIGFNENDSMTDEQYDAVSNASEDEWYNFINKNNLSVKRKTLRFSDEDKKELAIYGLLKHAPMFAGDKANCTCGKEFDSEEELTMHRVDVFIEEEAKLKIKE
jgi:hypothetical protein